MTRILTIAAALLLGSAVPGAAAPDLAHRTPAFEAKHAARHAPGHAAKHCALRRAEAELAARELVRSARHVRVRLERRAPFRGRGELLAMRAAANLEREARRVRRTLAADTRPIGFSYGRELTRESRHAFETTRERLSRLRTGPYLEREFADARAALRRLERLLGPDRPVWYHPTNPAGDRHAHVRGEPHRPTAWIRTAH